MKNLKLGLVAMSLCLVSGLMAGCGAASDNFVGKWGTQATNFNPLGANTPAYESLEIQKNGESYIINVKRVTYELNKQETKAPQVVMKWVENPQVGKLVMSKKGSNILETSGAQLTYVEKDKTLLLISPAGNLTYKPENKELIGQVKQNVQAFWKERLVNKNFMVDFGHPRFIVKDVKFTDAQAK